MTTPEQPTFSFFRDVPVATPAPKVGVVGATGLVGKTLLKVLAERRFPIGELHLFASDDSAGAIAETPVGPVEISRLEPKRVPRLNLVFMAAGSEVARGFGWKFAHRGAVVIDKSSYFRDKDYAPLVVPEVNPEALASHRGIIANPNCNTIPLVMVLSPLHRAWSLRAVTVVTFQSVSGQGRDGMMALERELAEPSAKPEVFPKRIAYNVIPWIGSGRRGFSDEELKVVYETRRILKLPRLPVRVTAVRVPTLVSHAMAVHLDFWKRADATAARKLLRECPGVRLMDSPEEGLMPTPLDAVGKDVVLVGRIRRDRGRRGLALWVVTDNLRKGAATNAVQIAEHLLSALA